MELKDRLQALTKEGVSAKALQQTYKYQKKYGFKMGTGEHGTHNNEADAFKHAFMQAYIMIVYPQRNAKLYGDYHEYIEGLHADENNMDLWNNSIGREVVYDIKCILDNRYDNYSKFFVFSGVHQFINIRLYCKEYKK